MTYSHNQLPFSSPLYDIIVGFRIGIIQAIKLGEIKKASYLGDCSARNSYDELRDNLEIKGNSTHHTTA